MIQIAKPIETGFSTADAEFPTIRQINSDVVLKFKDWQERFIEVFFSNPIAFRWQMAEILHDKERDDLCYEILNSSWIDLHIKQGIISQLEDYKHYKFNFNSCGQFEILSPSYSVKRREFELC